ncbi:MAG: phage tail sheath family protein [Saprospiraceae bacterium]|nr:phage tail sheath family protein [Saprospiraceae bacterium]
MADYRRPDVYIEEKTSFPVSILEVESAIPVFIGFTQKVPEAAPEEPVQINSMEEFEETFGGAFPETGIKSFKFDAATRKATIEPKEVVPDFMLYYAMKHYFKNGGAKCFVLSCGTYETGDPKKALDKSARKAALTEKVSQLLNRALEIEEVTLLVIPELVQLAEYTEPKDAVQADPAANPPVQAAPAVLESINDTAMSAAISEPLNSILSKNKYEKFFILDVAAPATDKKVDVKGFDEGSFIGYATEEKGQFMAFYYPYLVTSFKLEISDAAINSLTAKISVPGKNDIEFKDIVASEAVKAAVEEAKKDGATPNDVEAAAKAAAAGVKAPADPKELTAAEKYLLYKDLKQQIKNNAPKVVLPPSAAMAGIYVRVDNARGVWKAPANVKVEGIERPDKIITDTDHEDLNINPLNGRSICAIRTLPGFGTRVMGGRTLRGSSSDFRYISVRRFISIAEKSIKNAMKAYLFEPNNPTTWGLVKGGISNYLTQKWQQGALLGAKAEDSFFVRIGLGITMSKEDVLNGKMIVEIGMAVVRPAEFIILRIEQFLPEQLS